jgi:hypothetical protein
VKVNGESTDTAPIILNLEVRGQLHAPTTLPSENKPGTPGVRGLVSSKDGLGSYGEEKMLCLCRDSSPGTVQPAASRYTDWAIPVPLITLCQVNNTEKMLDFYFKKPSRFHTRDIKSDAGFKNSKWGITSEGTEVLQNILFQLLNVLLHFLIFHVAT